MAKKKQFIILDGNALLHRAWHSIPPLTTKDGRVVNAVYGFAKAIETLLDQYDPAYFAVAWDLPGKTFRHEAFDQYKAHREKKEPELYAQIPMIQDLLTSYDIPSISVEGYEADDVIGTIAAIYGPQPDTYVSIVTGDMDALQLVNGDVEVIAYVKGLSQTKTYDTAAVIERYGLRPDQLVDHKTLMGDASDNIPGIAGIGKKTATLLLQRYENMDGIFAAVASGKLEEKYAKKLRGQEEIVEQMRHLAEIVTDVDLHGFTAEDAPLGERDIEELAQKYHDFEFKSLHGKYAALLPEKGAQIAESSDLPKQQVVSFDELQGSTRYIAITTGDRDLFGNTIKAIALSDGTRISVVEHPDETMINTVIDQLMMAARVIGYDLKSVMHEMGSFEATYFDVMIAGYLLFPGDRQTSLEDLAYDFLGIELGEDISVQQRLQVIISLSQQLDAQIIEASLQSIARDIEMPLIPVLHTMETHGIAVDVPYLQAFSQRLGKDILALTERIQTLAGKEFNINSPSQLSEVLFTDLGLPTKGIKKTKTAYSTAASELEKLHGTHEMIPLILQYREFTKLKSTYVDVLPTLVGDDGRIHTTFHQVVAATGRLSSSDPNLQNIPIRTELGREIRKAFVAPKGRVLLACDYSQIELRLAAAISGDKALIEAFEQGADIHRRTAAMMLDKPEEDVTKEERSSAKAINFGILYGMGSRSLARSTGLSSEDAKKYIERYFEIHPSIREYMDQMKQQAKEHEYVETLFGRKRPLPDIHAKLPMLRAAAERMAINMPIQGTQADILKMAMLKIDAWLDEQDIDAQMLLQVHDELIFESAESDVERLKEAVIRIMQHIHTFDVPLVVSADVGKNWGELK